MNIYGYIRVSSRDQNEIRQLNALHSKGVKMLLVRLGKKRCQQISFASIDKGPRGSAGRKCPHTASKPLRIQKVFSAGFSLSVSISAPAELLCIGQPWIFEGFLFFWTQAHLTPAKEKRAKSTEKTGCPNKPENELKNVRETEDFEIRKRCPHVESCRTN